LFVLIDVAGEAWKSACYTRRLLRFLPVSDNPVAVRTRRGARHSTRSTGRLLNARDLAFLATCSC
jgi:hypothetical protein